MTDTTTLRVKTTTRDRLLAIASADFKGVSADDAIQKLLDEHWKLGCIEDWDRLRAENPDAWDQQLADNRAWDRLSPSLDNEPYQSDSPEWLATGGAPLTPQTDAA